MASLLIVDDDRDILELLNDYLGSLGHTIFAAQTGTAALTALQTGQVFSIAIVDWTLPDMNGSQLAAAIAAQLPQCKIILTTGRLDKLFDKNIHVAIRKPYSMRALALRVEALCQGGEPPERP